MFIKEVNITGFRSYRENTTIDSFSPKHNVIVGRNGSGKSNFFFAIQFVLSEEFAHLRPEQRMSVIHEGTGPRISSARVEIVFDNSDRRIPAIETNEVRVVRQIAQKKDQYYIDGKLVPRAEVVNLMESAGFSRSNPYYIVKQGKINELATAPDAQRLKLLKEVAGTRVYDERKEESLKILKETSSKVKKIEDLLNYIDERLNTLESEKEDLKEYQKWDKQKRSIEYTMYDVEIREARKKLDHLAEQREDLNQRQNKVSSDLMDVQSRGMKASGEQRKLESRFKGMKEEKESLLQERAQLFEKRTALELKIKDLKEDVEKERSGRSRAEGELEKLKAEIAEKQEELESIVPAYEKLLESEERLKSDVRIAENRLKELLLKQGHGHQFKSVAERDDFFEKEIRFVRSQLRDTEEQMQTIERSLEEEASDEQGVNDQIRNIGLQLEDTISELETTNTAYARLRKDFDKAVYAHLESGRAEREKREHVDQLKADLQHQENTLRGLTNKPAVNGMESVRKVLQWFRENNTNGKYDDVTNGYYGTLIELIECDPVYYQAIEVTAAGRLFYHVVSDDRVAMKILNKINYMNLPGTIDFFPLLRLTSPHRRSTNDPDARPMIDCLNYDSKFETAFRQVFAATVIVRTMQVGQRMAKNEGFDAVTLEGDQISRRGALTGGYIDRKKSKLEIFNSIKEMKQQLEDASVELEKLTRNVTHKQQEVEKIRMEMEKVELDLRRLKDQHRDLSERRKFANEQLGSNTRNTDQKKSQLLVLKNRIRELQDKKATISSELEQPMQSQLTGDEQKQMDGFQNQSKTLPRIENLLQTNLVRKRDNLSSKVGDISVDEKRHNLENDNSELASVISRQTEINRIIDELDRDLKEYEEAAEKLTREIDDVQEQQKDLEQQMAEFSKQVEMIFTKQSTLYTKREESVKKIRDLGSLPTEAFSKYQNLTSKQLDKKLSEALNELKKYENVNKKALDQFVQASSQKEDLTKRMEEQRKNEKAIENLLDVLENRKYEAILFTFKQVSKNFKDVFSKLVPGGRGDLVMQMNSQETDEADRQKSTVENFTGVSIRISFTSDAETREMQQLSGGSKDIGGTGHDFCNSKM
ncbi:unnamed protein product, partial [Mesorhabditis belari]|uniref:Structural maintenance of chromosomes protein 3 n=1 Tax=Mesorhabditis belari TaxID=2138241 RepID=A0AAF3FNG4_9BILA